jgi:DNA-binding CsgD family transcriptional regulator
MIPHLVEHSSSFAWKQNTRRELSDILESISDAFFAVDREWRFTYVNRRTEELWSKSRQDLLGKILWEGFSAVRAVAQSPTGQGGHNVILAVPREVLQRVENRSEDEPSGRELEILLLAARGLSNRQISASLSLSEAIVKRYLANLYAKMDVGSRGEATRKALSEGWFTARDVTQGEDAPDKAGI